MNDNQSPSVSKKGLLLLLAITLAYAFLTFWRLGSHTMPSTVYHSDFTTEGTNEIVLDLGEETAVDQVMIFLGHMMNRTVAVSYFDESAGEWVVATEDDDVDDLYNWNTFDVGEETRFLGIVTKNAAAEYHEMIITDANGDRLIPVNAEDYPELFDEQDLIGETLTYMDRTMFDEVYYAGSAYEFSTGQEMLEQTHPPFGKWIIALGEALFGVNPFGWRFMISLMATLMLPIMFWFVWRLFFIEEIALTATALLSLEFMHFTLGRIATIDTPVAFFILLMAALFLRYMQQIREELLAGKEKPDRKVRLWMVLASVATGLGVSTKWTAFYMMAAMALAFLFCMILWSIQAETKEQKGFLRRCLIGGLLSFSLIPLVLYTLSFSADCYTAGLSFLLLPQVMFAHSEYMLHFHDDIVFEHPYASPWYTWLIDKVPLLDSGTFLPDSKTSVVATMGNPFILWAGLPALVHNLYRLIFKKDTTSGIILFGYTAMLLPWVFIKRTVFIYQYYGSILFLVMALAYSLYLLSKKWPLAKTIYMEATLLVFILFYPFISGMEISLAHIYYYLQWLPDWRFLK